MSIQFKKILIVDKANKIARKISFEPGINIITSTDNSVGKSSLSLMLLYGFGAKVQFSDKWNMENIFTKLTLCKDDIDIHIIRYKDTYTILTQNEKFFFPLQKSGYADKLYDLLGLTIKIKDKNSDFYSTAVPSIYLLPYYLSQTKADEDRSVFLDLGMYAKKDLYDALYYHVGALDNNYTNLIKQLTKTLLELEQLKKNKEKEYVEIQYLEEKIRENNSVAISNVDKELKVYIEIYEKFTKKSQELYELIKRQKEIKQEIKLLQKSLRDNTAFTDKLLNEQEIYCPNCKTDITDFVSSALKIGMAESDITNEIADLKAELLDIERKISQTQDKLHQLRSNIEDVEQRRNNIKITRALIVWNDELKKAKEKFATTQLQIDEFEKLLSDIRLQLKEYDTRKRNADNNYRVIFSGLLSEANVQGDNIDLSNLTLYQTVKLSGSEIPRVAIARFFALLESKEAGSVIMPIIFDFPNLDMTPNNLTKCFTIMCKRISDTRKYPQSLVFSINCEERIAATNCDLGNTHIINMDNLIVDNPQKRQLLCSHDFIANLNEINDMLQQ